eukprot:TRINITY_DN1177_c0_g4_i1.p1 TRINITY_DN1177_c0_g4~~TRINITY_DN1177_c0_g4_i1.p1  ORF type:complete len:227 (-),score=73.75 TRINITY_DN1177_c0_g4_i1:137-739(-)
MAKASKMFIVAGAAAAALCGLRQAFVPPAGRNMPSAVGAAAMLGAAPAFADKIDVAAEALSKASYPFIKEIDWTSDVYAKLPTQGPLEVLKAIDKMLIMGAAMDPVALKAGTLAHSSGISHVDGKGVTTLADYTAMNKAIGHMVASVPASKTMDVYNAFAKFNLGSDIGPYMMSRVSKQDAEAAYKAFLDFKDVVKASQR